MLNLYTTIRDRDGFNKLMVRELLFVEYTCMREETKFGLWSNTNYFAFITSGKKMWRTIYHSYIVGDEDILFIKKGANLTHQFFDEQFCAIFVFIPDEFIQSFLKKHSSFLKGNQRDLSGQDAVLPIENNEILKNYTLSIATYLSANYQLEEKLIILKLEELLLNLVSNGKYQALTDYFVSLCQSESYHMERVMEENFAYNLKLEEYAELCHMSLSTFKKNFKKTYHVSPAKWLKYKKLDLALHKILTSNLPVAQIAFECGFEATSHFIRVFKQEYGLTPLQYRQKKY